MTTDRERIDALVERVRRLEKVSDHAYELTRRARELRDEQWALVRLLGILDLEQALADLGRPVGETWPLGETRRVDLSNAAIPSDYNDD